APQGPREAQLPHVVRPERASPLARVRPPRGDDGGRDRGRPACRPSRSAAARHRQGRDARGRGLARDHLGAALSEVPRVGRRVARRRGAPPGRRAADRRGGPRPGGGRHLGRPARCPRREPRELREAARGAGGDRDVEARRREVLRHAGRARRPRHRQADGGRRRHGRPAVPGDRPRDRDLAPVPRPDQGHGHPRVARQRVRQV
ncbi:MAG: Ribonuclease Y, partial [uncultured Thermoleophilia bacterium]